MLRLFVLAGVLSGAVVLVGCGGDEDGDSADYVLGVRALLGRLEEQRQDIRLRSSQGVSEGDE